MNTPWGQSQHTLQHKEGIVEVSTAGHGGIILSHERALEMATKTGVTHSPFLKNNAYEEDLDALIPLIAFELWRDEEDKKGMIQAVLNYREGYYPNCFLSYCRKLIA